MDLQLIDDLLYLWAQWALSGIHGGLSFPKQSTLGRFRPASGNRLTLIPDAQAMDIEQIINRLSPNHREVLKQHYLVTGTPADKAKTMHCNKSTYYRWLTEAKQQIAQDLKK